MAESEEKLNRLLIKVKEESEKTCLKLNIQNMKIMTSGPWSLAPGSKSICMVTLATKFTDTCSLEENIGQN